MKKFLLLTFSLFALLEMCAQSVGDFFTENGIKYKITQTTPMEVTVAQSDYSGDVTIPQEVVNNSVTYKVTSIEGYAFYGCNSLTSIIIPSSITTIGGKAFSGCSSLTSITIPEGVTTIGFNAFSGCTSLKSITIPESVTQIGEDAFKNTPWYNNFEDGEIYIGKVLYKYKGEMPQNTTINIKEGVTQIGVNAFSGCNGLTSITIPESVTTIGGYAFSNCSSLTSITIPEGVTIIGHFAFSNCSSLTSIIIPNSVTTIEGRAFEGCSSLTSITIPESVTSIGSYAFYGCSNLEKIVCLAKEIPTLKNYALYNVSPYTILVPINSVDVYKNAVRWSIYNDKIIGGYVVKGLSNNDTKGVVNITQPIVEKDKQTTITAIAAENHIFTQWSDGVKENPRTITVVSDTTFTAEFEKNAEQNNQEDNKNNDVAISENEAIKLLVYPSPATSVINITNAEDGTMVRVFNVNGKVVLDTSLECKQLNISNLEKGIYS